MGMSAPVQPPKVNGAAQVQTVQPRGMFWEPILAAIAIFLIGAFIVAAVLSIKPQPLAASPAPGTQQTAPLDRPAGNDSVDPLNPFSIWHFGRFM